MNDPTYAKIEQGTLLVASPDAEPGLHSRAVVLICEHTQAGSFGLIINKPFDIEMPEELMNIEEINHPKVHLRLGGKMQQNQMMLLHNSPNAGADTLKVLDNVHLGGDLNFLQESILDDNCHHLNLCFGYTGWAIGELEKEFMTGLWFLHPGSKELIFETPPEKVWQTILRKMGGKYSSMSMLPEDLTLN